MSTERKIRAIVSDLVNIPETGTYEQAKWREDQAVEELVRLFERRPTPTDCRHEPSFPGLRTVCLVLSDPTLVCHHAETRCQYEQPHQIEVCRLFT
jgi:hypothetical protein